MEPALKQRVVGAIVLVALAVIFLPMLIKGPAPESGVSDVPLDLPDAPKGDYETRELPLVAPGATPAGGAVGLSGAASGEALPTVEADPKAPAVEGMLPAATAGGNFAVTFGSYASVADAGRVVAALTAAQLVSYQEPLAASGGRTLHRVLVGPYSTRASAESARLSAARVHSGVDAKVIQLDAVAEAPASSIASAAAPQSAATASVSKPVPLASAPVSQAKPLAAAAVAKPTVLPESKPTTASRPGDTKVAMTKPAATPVATAMTKPAASNVGFAVQLGAFGNAAEATKLRDRARAAGFSAFVESVRTDKGTLSRVRIGPVADRALADKLKAQVSSKLGVSGIVQPHP